MSNILLRSLLGTRCEERQCAVTRGVELMAVGEHVVEGNEAMDETGRLT